MNRTVTLEIAGARYRVTTDAQEAHLERLAGLINERISALGPRAGRAATPAQLLAVVALGLADDLSAAQEKKQRIENLTRKALNTAIERIDRRLAETAAQGAASESIGSVPKASHRSNSSKTPEP